MSKEINMFGDLFKNLHLFFQAAVREPFSVICLRNDANFLDQ